MLAASSKQSATAASENIANDMALIHVEQMRPGSAQSSCHSFSPVERQGMLCRSTVQQHINRQAGLVCSAVYIWQARWS